MVVQWLGLHTLTAKAPGSIPRQGTKIQHATQHGQKKKKNSKYYFLKNLYPCNFSSAREL